ncbi:hypothetical protein [Desulfovirgula thermocuniculi]|uniref:hypothetical protein n=1 Tax=Desulfovirgula thermocuniculi TaxID=348842 RepID=UPI00040B1888|nr:hypothetical protein [Desulfovirgula thermocuniculi]
MSLGITEGFTMRAYGIFDGVAKDDMFAVAAVPDFATWKKVILTPIPKGVVYLTYEYIFPDNKLIAKE